MGAKFGVPWGDGLCAGGDVCGRVDSGISYGTIYSLCDTSSAYSDSLEVVVGCC